MIKKFFDTLSREKKHRFENDPRIITLSTEMSKRIKLLNTFELKYNTIIYLPRWLVQEPEIEETQSKLDSILKKLKMEISHK